MRLLCSAATSSPPSPMLYDRESASLLCSPRPRRLTYYRRLSGPDTHACGREGEARQQKVHTRREKASCYRVCTTGPASTGEGRTAIWEPSLYDGISPAISYLLRRPRVLPGHVRRRRLVALRPIRTELARSYGSRALQWTPGRCLTHRVSFAVSARVPSPSVACSPHSFWTCPLAHRQSSPRIAVTPLSSALLLTAPSLDGSPEIRVQCDILSARTTCSAGLLRKRGSSVLRNAFAIWSVLIVVQRASCPLCKRARAHFSPLLAAKQRKVSTYDVDGMQGTVMLTIPPVLMPAC